MKTCHCTKTRARRAWPLIALVACLFLAPQVLAQPARSARSVCPELNSSASPAEQALCWFENDERTAAACKSERLGQGASGQGFGAHGVDAQAVSDCIWNAVSWCVDAALDLAPVANACFLAHVRAGEFDKAVSMGEQLRSPSQEAKKCLKALSTVHARIVSNPPGAEITVDGRLWGKAPVEVKLTGNWRKTQVVARFDPGSGREAIQVELPPGELIAAFDRRQCVMGDVMIQGPQSAEPRSQPLPAAGPPGGQPSVDTPTDTEAPTRPTGTPEDTETPTDPAAAPTDTEASAGPAGTPTDTETPASPADTHTDIKTPASPAAAPTDTETPASRAHKQEGVSVAGLILTGLGAAGFVTGSILFAVAASRSSDLADAEPGTRWTEEMQDDYDSVTWLRIGGGLALQAGAVLSGIGLVFLLGASSEKDESEISGLKLAPVGNGPTLEWSF